jgi:hypothetical protein
MDMAGTETIGYLPPKRVIDAAQLSRVDCRLNIVTRFS